MEIARAARLLTLARVAGTAAVSAQQGPTQAELDAAASNTNDWLLSRHDYGGQRFADLDLINRDNVGTIRVGAFRLEDGAPVWRFNTIPEPGEPGSETWSDPASDQIGGGAVWTGAPNNGGNATYTVDGKQYIALMSGNTSPLWPTPPAEGQVIIFGLPD